VCTRKAVWTLFVRLHILLGNLSPLPSYRHHTIAGIVIERFGRFNRVLQPGLSCIVPCMDAPRVFTWRKTYVDVNKKVRDETITQFRVDLRESLFDFVKQDVYSRDTVLLEVRRSPASP
jgi:hypothetical protein